MKKSFITASIIIIVLGLLVNTGCKKSQETGDYALVVTLHEGVTGTPAEGTYLFNLDDTVPYSYDLESGYTRLTVLFDGEKVENSGTITISANHTLEAYASEGSGDWLLVISYNADSVTGTPASGYYYHNLGDQIPYSFTAASGYTNLTVKLDGVTIANSGTITISKDHTMYAYAEKEYYIQGDWTLQETYEDNSAFTVTATFSGAIESGTVVDSDGGTGTYTVSGNIVKFTLEYPDVTYEYSGYFTDEETMSGSSKRYYNNENTYKKGSWKATLNSDSTASHRSLSVTNKGTISRDCP